MIDWLYKNILRGSNYLVEQKDAEQINDYVSKQLIRPFYIGRKQSLWGETADKLSISGKKIGWVPNKLPASFLADTVESEIADAFAAQEGMLQSDKKHCNQAREIMQQLNISHLGQYRPYYLSDGEKKLLWFITQWVKQPEYLIVGHLPSSLSKTRTDELLDFLIQSETESKNNITMVLGYIAQQNSWCSKLQTNEKWKIIHKLPCL